VENEGFRLASVMTHRAGLKPFIALREPRVDLRSTLAVADEYGGRNGVIILRHEALTWVKRQSRRVVNIVI